MSYKKCKYTSRWWGRNTAVNSGSTTTNVNFFSLHIHCGLSANYNWILQPTI